MELRDVERALLPFNWTYVHELNDGETFGVVVDGQHHTATKVHSVDKEDSDWDRDLAVVIQIGDQYFKKTGHAQVGSHCYGDYEPSWDTNLTEVKPKIVPVTVWE